MGGVNGHRLVPLIVDDQTSPTGIVTGVQNAISQGAFGIVTFSGIFFAAARYANQQGIPVNGASVDGPEWGQQPYTNMFASDRGSLNPANPVNTGIGNFVKAHGGTVIATYGLGISPLSAKSAVGIARSFEVAGGKTGVIDTSVPFGAVDFTTAALVAKGKSVDSLVPSLTNASDFALATSYNQAGVKLKVAVFSVGYQPSIVKSPIWPTLQGAYFTTPFRPFSLPNAGTQQMQAALRRYAHFSATQFPDYGQYQAWLGADLMIKGLQLAGTNPTRTAVIRKLRSITNYTGNAILPIAINYRTVFGTDPSQCDWYMRAVPGGFVAASAKPSCGRDIPGTSVAPSS
jgi:hypothetical protein